MGERLCESKGESVCFPDFLKVLEGFLFVLVFLPKKKKNNAPNTDDNLRRGTGWAFKYSPVTNQTTDLRLCPWRPWFGPRLRPKRLYSAVGKHKGNVAETQRSAQVSSGSAELANTRTHTHTHFHYCVCKVTAEVQQINRSALDKGQAIAGKAARQRLVCHREMNKH